MGMLFGAPFAEAGGVLSILAFTALFGATGTVILNLLVATHSEKALSRSRIAERCGTAPSLACTLGSVARCRMKAAVPSASSSVLATMPASGKSATASPTESEAPAI